MVVLCPNDLQEGVLMYLLCVVCTLSLEYILVHIIVSKICVLALLDIYQLEKYVLVCALCQLYQKDTYRYRCAQK